MAMEPLPHGFGEFSMAMTDDASLASLWSLPPTLQDLHCYQSVQEVKQRLAVVTAELRVAREEVRHKEQNIASLVEQVRRTVQERDLLRQQQHLLLAREMEASATPCPLLTSSPPVAVNRAATFAMPSSAAVDSRSTAAAAIEVPSFAARDLPSGGSSRASATPAACPLTSSSSPMAVDRAAVIRPFAVSGSAAMIKPFAVAGSADVVTRSMAAALEVPSFPALAGEDMSTTMALELLAARRPLPQQGRLVQAVIEAGPLLQNLLVAGALPQWRNRHRRRRWTTP